MKILEVIKGDITQLEVSVIVNSAHPTLLAGSGVCGAIHQAAGKKLEEACKTIGSCSPGKAVLTPGYNLKAKYVIHTVVSHAEKYGQLSSSDQETLIQCYEQSLKLAKEYGLKTLAFPSLGTGIRAFPLKETAELAVKTVTEYLNKFPGAFEKIYFVMYSDESYKTYNEYIHKN